MELNEDSSKHLPPLPLHTDVVLDRIFAFLSIEDLKSCRLVCQKWRYASQGIFRKKVAVVFKNTEYPVNIFGKVVKPSTASTANFLHTFEGREIPSDSYYFYDEAWNWGDMTNIRFLVQYGKTIRNFKADVQGDLNTTISTEEIYSFRNKLLMFMPNLEQLSLKISILELNRPIKFAATNFENFTNVQLPYLTNVSIRIGCEENQALTDQEKQIASNVFVDIIKRTKKLETLDINSCPAMTEMMKKLPRESFKLLKHLSINDWKCQNGDAFNMFKFLLELLYENSFKLISFSTQFEFANCEENYMKESIHLLLNILNWQKNNLQTLSINLPTFTGNGQHFEDALAGTMAGIKFPTMFKLSTLKLDHSQTILFQLFIDYDGLINWTKMFPQLKTLDYHLKRGREEGSIFHAFRSINCSSLTKVTVTVAEEQESELGEDSLGWSASFLKLYGLCKMIYPILKIFEVTYINGRVVHTFSSRDLFLMTNRPNGIHEREGQDDYDEEGDEDPDRRFQESEFFDTQFDYNSDQYEDDDGDMLPHTLENQNVDNEFDEDM